MKNTKFIKVALVAGLLTVTSSVFAEAPDAFDGVPTKTISNEKLEKLSGKALLSRSVPIATNGTSVTNKSQSVWGSLWGNIYNGVTTGGTRGAAQRGQLGGCGGGFGKNGNC